LGDAPTQPESLPKSLCLAGVLTALLATGISSYLLINAFLSDGLPPGCGSGSGCEAVLSSKWSSMAGIPVALPALIVHGLLTALIAVVGYGNVSLSKSAAKALAFVACLAIGAAIWFVIVQLVILKAICPWCMVDHGFAVFASVTGLFLALKTLSASGQGPWVGIGGLLAIVLVAASAGLQASTATTKVVTLSDMPADSDFDETADGVRMAGLLNGTLRLVVDDEPNTGTSDAPMIGLMYDYACLHCRHSHQVMLNYLDENPDAFRIVFLPTPLNQQCNEHAPDNPGARFDDSCDLARLALAVWLTKPEAFMGFDRWLYEPQTPRSADEAQQQAEQILGQEALSAALTNPRINEIMKRNAQAYGNSGTDRVPVLLHPGSASVVGRVEDGSHLQTILTDFISLP